MSDTVIDKEVVLSKTSGGEFGLFFNQWKAPLEQKCNCIFYFSSWLIYKSCISYAFVVFFSSDSIKHRADSTRYKVIDIDPCVS